MDLSNLARIAAVFGVVLLVLAGILYLLDRLDIPLGNLPGDIKFQRGNFTCAVPLVSGLIISVVLTLLLNLILYFISK
ncbi:MAG: DUF2905 domain-containing protein [Anaerolineales bacterium]